MMRKISREEKEKNYPSLQYKKITKVNDMKSEWYGDDDMKNEVVKMTCVLPTRNRWFDYVEDERLNTMRKWKEKFAPVRGFQRSLSWEVFVKFQ